MPAATSPSNLFAFSYYLCAKSPANYYYLNEF
jgi:hypothetical protein